MSETRTNEGGEKIPHFVNDPKINAATAPELKLYRPKINYFKAALYVLAHILVGVLSAFAWEFMKREPALQMGNIVSNSLLITLILLLLTLRFTFIWFIRVYQHYAKSETRLRCCMIPSCSEYAVLAFKKYGAIWGGIKTIKRLHRCHPPGGVDYP